MKRIILLSLLCSLTPFSSYGNDSFYRIGVTIGGYGLISLSFERHIGDYSMRVNMGTTMGEIDLAFTVNRYFSQSDTKVFTGIGIWNVIFPFFIFDRDKKLGHIHWVTVPVGIDNKTSGGNYLGIESDMHFFITGRREDGSKVRFNSPIFHERFLPLPAFYYKYRMGE